MIDKVSDCRVFHKLQNQNKMFFMGKVAVIKTKQTDSSPEDFIAGIKDGQQQADTRTILKLMESASKEKAIMWGSSMIGFGNVRYKSPASEREVDWFRIGFSPRKANFSLHLIDLDPLAALLEKLGKHKLGKGCLYINKLSDVDLKVLGKIINAAGKGK